MSQQSGTIRSFDNSFTHGSLSHDQNSGASVQFGADQVQGLKSLSVGERVSFDVVEEDKQGHAENIQRVGGNLESYQDLGGLYS